MKILLADDDDNKASQVKAFLEAGWSGATVARAKSLQSALSTILTDNYDLILLDMTMPTFDISENDNGGRPQPLAGREVLRQVARKSVVARVVVLTQFPQFGQGAEARTLSQLHEELARRYPQIYRGLIYYESASQAWREDLRVIVDEVAGSAK